MALSPRLDLRQTQSLVMTPQLQQAIKLLALSNLEIEGFLAEALEANPLLEAGEIAQEKGETVEQPAEPSTSDKLIQDGNGEADAPLDIDPAALDRDRDTGDWSAAPSGGEHGARKVSTSRIAALPGRRWPNTSRRRSAPPRAIRAPASSPAR